MDLCREFGETTRVAVTKQLGISTLTAHAHLVRLDELRLVEYAGGPVGIVDTLVQRVEGWAA